MTTALIASDWYIIPVFPSGYDLKGLETLWRTVEKVKQRYNPNLQLLGVLLGNFDSRPKLDADIQRMLSQKFGGQLVSRPSSIEASSTARRASTNRPSLSTPPGSRRLSSIWPSHAEVLARLEKSLQAETTPPAEYQEATNG